MPAACAAAFAHATSGRCALAAPLDCFRVPTVALTPREHRLARLELWGYGLLMLLPYALMAWGLR